MPKGILKPTTAKHARPMRTGADRQSQLCIPSFHLEKDPIDVYATDEAYWQSFWHRPGVNAAAHIPRRN